MRLPQQQQARRVPLLVPEPEPGREPSVPEQAPGMAPEPELPSA